MGGEILTTYLHPTGSPSSNCSPVGRPLSQTHRFFATGAEGAEGSRANRIGIFVFAVGMMGAKKSQGKEKLTGIDLIDWFIGSLVDRLIG